MLRQYTKLIQNVTKLPNFRVTNNFNMFVKSLGNIDFEQKLTSQ